MIVVIDASAAVEVALNRIDALFFRKKLEDADLVLAPDIYPSEIANVFWKYGNFSDLSEELCEKGRAFCMELVDDYLPSTDVCREVLSESLRIGHPSYDVFYLIAARRNNAFLLTKDRKMRSIARELKIKVLYP